MQMSKPLFPEYEAVVDRDAGGVIVTAIRSPRKILDEFRALLRATCGISAPLLNLQTRRTSFQCAAPTLPGFTRLS
jgi:hypothetical protein